MTQIHIVHYTPWQLVYTVAEIWVLTFFGQSPRQYGETCNYLLTTLQKLPGGLSGGQDKERVNLYNKCLLSALACQCRSNNDLCWRLKLFLGLNHRPHWTLAGREGIPLCWMCRGGGGGMWSSAEHWSNPAVSAGQDKGSGFKLDWMLLIGRLWE